MTYIEQQGSINKFEMLEFVSRSDFIITNHEYSVGISNIFKNISKPKVQVIGFRYKSDQIIEIANTQSIPIYYHDDLPSRIYHTHKIINSILSREFYLPLAKLLGDIVDKNTIKEIV